IDLIVDRNAVTSTGTKNVWGVYALNNSTGRVETLTARATIMASGGAGRTYLFSTAPRGATGDGIAMAWRAGARVSNMEMMQFHPTCLYNLEVKNFLITEAERGEGGHLKLPPSVKGGYQGGGHQFMQRVIPERMDLGTRDVVVGDIDHEIKRLGLDYVLLDRAHCDPAFVKGHFPNIYDKLLGLGIDMTKEPIPVVPAEHYTCGGILIDLNGRTDLPGLYAAGEASRSEEHTSELQSRENLVCRLLLEKK